MRADVAISDQISSDPINGLSVGVRIRIVGLLQKERRTLVVGGGQI
jgi:hypothetical protein